MDLDAGAPVALRRAPEWTGRVVGRVVDGKAYVRFDAGGSGNFDVADLVPLEDKRWPPDTEHKGAPA